MTFLYYASIIAFGMVIIKELSFYLLRLPVYEFLADLSGLIFYLLAVSGFIITISWIITYIVWFVSGATSSFFYTGTYGPGIF